MGCVDGPWGGWWLTPHTPPWQSLACMGGVGCGSCGECCGCIWVRMGGAAACWGMRRSIAGSPAISSALQGRIRPPACPICHSKAAPTNTTVSSGNRVQWGSHPHPLLWAGQHIPGAAGSSISEGIRFSGARYDRAAPTGSQIGRRGRMSCCGGMEGMGEGGLLRKVGRGGHGSG